MRTRNVHIYHHFESKPCDKCGYISNTGSFDRDAFHLHLMHVVGESNVLLERILKQKKVKDDTSNNPQ